MVDVSKIEGPSGPPESSGKKDKSAIDADKFKQEMRRRVTEVSQVDPDEQKKRKRREEADDEEEPVEEAAMPPSQVAPFSLEQPPKKASPMAMEGPGISPTESAQKASMPAPPSKTFQTSSTDEMADDSGVLEEEAFIETAPTPPAAEKAPVSEAPPPTRVSAPPPSEETPPTPQQQQQPPVRAPAEAGEQQSQQQPQKKKPAEPVVGPPVTALKKQQPAAPKEGTPPPPPEKKGTTAAELEQEQPAKRAETAGFFEQMGKDEGEREGRKQAKTPEELAQEAAIQGATPPPATPFAPSLDEKGGKKVEGKEISEEMAAGAPLPVPGELPGLAAPPPPPEALPSYANIPPQVMELFDRMVGVMTVMSMSGITETVITLNSPQFASSVFFGSQIIIQEYSTAPQAYNIQLNGTPQAVALFQGNADDLLAAFQAGNYNFRVNRLETGHLTERPLFKRKEKAGGDKEAGEGQK